MDVRRIFAMIHRFWQNASKTDSVSPKAARLPMSISPSLSVQSGSPSPLGATVQTDGQVNFAVSAPRADAVDLCLYWNKRDPQAESVRVRMPERTHGVWHASIIGLPENVRYGYRVEGPWKPAEGLYFNHQKVLLDPYAKMVDAPSRHHNSMLGRLLDGNPNLDDSGEFAPKGIVKRIPSFDWKGAERPCIPMHETVIYETHVKGFSNLNRALRKKIRGTYAGLAHKKSISYLKDLGITTVQLLPVHHHLDDGFLLSRGLVNFWGYNTLAFFTPEVRYASTDDPIREFREMVRAFHREGMEIILDVVYNHTCEAGIYGPTCLFRGLDNAAYYRAAPSDPGSYDDVTGCGNSVDISHPDAMKLVLDSLRYWVSEMGVDGFRFDLAATLGRDPRDFTRNSAFFRAVHQDPVLRSVKLIAEPWDIGKGGYQQGNFPVLWCELNGKYRDCVRRFWKGDPVTGEFATRITGSEDLFAHNGRLPTSSINIVTSHDGFTLRDLVSYNHKHNEANGELNRDGDAHNLSYNYGVEGKTDDEAILEIRKRQVRNFLTTLICSQGVPFLTAGDEKLRTQLGNNNAYCQDNDLSWLEWDEKDSEAKSMYLFVRKLLDFRRNHPSLRKQRFFSGNEMNGTGLADVTWLNVEGEQKDINDWNLNKPGAFAMMIHREASFQHEPLTGFLLFFFNARPKDLKVRFPQNPDFRWECIVDTYDPKGEPSEKNASPGDRRKLRSRSVQIWRELA